jgi:hypothetical protein
VHDIAGNPNILKNAVPTLTTIKNLFHYDLLFFQETDLRGFNFFVCATAQELWCRVLPLCCPAVTFDVRSGVAIKLE